VPLSGDTFEAEIADESGALMLYQPSRAKARAFYPLAAVLKDRVAHRERVTRGAGGTRRARVRQPKIQ
jgi:hypothetical protein